jgi:site-specific DNA-methyltransferase (adenine-specific)
MSQRLDWQTPKAVYDTLDKEFHFDFDPCPHNPTFNGLTCEWGKSNFVNPPYGRQITDWIVKGCAQYLQGKTVVFLIPSRTDTRWWHQYIMVHATEIRFIKGRLKFDGSKNSAPFPSAIVVMKAITTSRRGSRAVSFDMAYNQTGSAENKITERRTHLTFGVNGAGILERERVAEKLNHTGPDLLEAMKCCSNLQMRIERRIHGEG